MAQPKPRTGCSDAVRLILQSTRKSMTIHEIQAALPTRTYKELMNAVQAMARRGEVRQRSLRGGTNGSRTAWQWAEEVVAPRPACLLAEVWR